MAKRRARERASTAPAAAGSAEACQDVTSAAEAGASTAELAEAAKAATPAPTVAESHTSPIHPKGEELALPSPSPEPSPPSSPSSLEPPPAGSLTRFQKFEVRRVHRSVLKGAPYNPRTIRDSARKRLRANLDVDKGGTGLVEPLIWNEVTGNLLSGHQRLRELDSLERKPDYVLDVSVVRLDDKAEKEQNIFLNNTETQGDFDLVKLESLYRTDGLVPERTGFNTAEIVTMFGGTPAIEDPQILLDLADIYRKMEQRHRDLVDKLEKRDNPNFYLVAVFENSEAVDVFLRRLGMDEEESRYIDGRLIQPVNEAPAEPEELILQVVCDFCKHEQPVKRSDGDEVKCAQCGMGLTLEWPDATG
jgi:hypothetical protein